jgi:hypothetical protein
MEVMKEDREDKPKRQDRIERLTRCLYQPHALLRGLPGERV